MFSFPVFVCMLDQYFFTICFYRYWTISLRDPTMMLVRGSSVFISCVLLRLTVLNKLADKKAKMTVEWCMNWK